MIFFRRIKYQIYLFQLENYNLKRYFNISLRTLFAVPKEQRQKIVWTAKLKFLTALSFFLILAVSSAYVNFGYGIISFFIFLLLVFAYPLLLIVAMLLLYLPEACIRKIIVSRASVKIKKLKNLTVIGIAGSYGKTTTKEAVSAVLAEKFKVLKTPENINTDIGIARLIQNELDDTIEVFIVEMGEYKRGDIRGICEIVKPRLGIITGINEAHLERMGSLENTVAVIFELAESTAQKVFLNTDDSLVSRNYQRYTGNKKLYFYGVSDTEAAEYKTENINFSENISGYTFEMKNKNENLGEFQISLLGEYALGTAMAGVLVGKEMGVDIIAIKEGIKKIKASEHRLEVVPTKNGVTVIDDSYNGNPAGAEAAIKVLSKFRNKRKIYVTPGLVEMGGAAERVHIDLGKKLAMATNLVVLVKNSVTGYIIEGLKSAGFDMGNVLVFDSAAETHAKLGSIIKTGDVVLFQNDWPDNYL